MDVDTGTAFTFALSGIWAQMRLESKTNCFSVAKLLLLKESSCHYQKSSFPGSILSFFFFPVDCSSRNLKICGRDVQGTKICYWVFSFRYWTACLLTLTREGEYLSAQLLYSVVKQQLGMLVCMPVESYYMYICVLNEIWHFIILCSTYNEIPDFIKTYIRTQCVRNIQICLGKLREELIEEIEHELIWALEAFQVDGGGKDVPRRKGRK